MAPFLFHPYQQNALAVLPCLLLQRFAMCGRARADTHVVLAMPIADLPSVENLNLAYTAVTDAGLAALAEGRCVWGKTTGRRA